MFKTWESIDESRGVILTTSNGILTATAEKLKSQIGPIWNAQCVPYGKHSALRGKVQPVNLGYSSVVASRPLSYYERKLLGMERTVRSPLVEFL